MRLIGVDYGEKRVGVAQSDPTGSMALPLLVIDVRGPKQLLRDLRAVCREQEATTIVVGMPLNMDGSRGVMADKVEAFVEKLRASVTIPVVCWDERLSTSAVERVLLEADMSRQRRKQVRDKLAAQVILQGYMDQPGNGASLDDMEMDPGQ